VSQGGPRNGRRQHGRMNTLQFISTCTKMGSQAVVWKVSPAEELSDLASMGLTLLTISSYGSTSMSEFEFLSILLLT